MKPFFRRTAALCLIVLGLLAISFGSCTNKAWICATCGSRKSAVGLSFPVCSFLPMRQAETSELERWMINESGSHTHHWKCTEYMDTYLFLGRSFVCWKAPPIYFAPIDTLKDFVDTASPAQIQEFVKVMQHGTEKQQQEAVDGLAERRLVRAKNK